MTSEKKSPPVAPTLKKAPSIRVLGVGGAGCNAVSHLASSSLPGLSYAVLNTDAAALDQSPIEPRLVLGAKCTRGLGAGGDPERGQAAAEETLAEVRALCEGADLVFVVAGLGGGTGTGASPVIARVAREIGALVIGLVILPFDCEGTRRSRQAALGLHALTEIADGVICLPNQKVLKLIDQKTSLIKAFEITNDLVAQGVRGLWRLLSRPGLINVDFADLCAVTRGKHAESALAIAEAAGENRSREVIEKLLAHPLIEGGQCLSDASEVLVAIAGGPDLSMDDVTRVMEQINRQCEHAHLIMGAAVDEDLRDHLIVTLVASRRSARPEPPSTSTALPVPLRKDGEPISVVTNRPPLETQISGFGDSPRPPSRFVAPAPPLTPERREQILNQQSAAGPRHRKNVARMKQGQLPLEIVSRGRFEESEPTIYHGQDLDVPTYIRRGVALN